MTRVLLVPFHPPGHTEPMVALAAQLRAQGHSVTAFDESNRNRWRLDAPIPSSMLADSAAMARHMFFGDVADMTKDIVDLAGACDAELIVADVMMPGGGLAAELTGLPWVSLSVLPIPELDAHRWFIPEHARSAFAPASTLESLGLPTSDERSLLGRTSSWLHLVPTTPRFAGYPEVPASMALVGPFTPVPPAPVIAPTGTPTVVVATTTTKPAALGRQAYVQNRYVHAAAEALGGLDVHGLVTHESRDRPPDNVQFIGNVPHDELFDRSAAVVTHGGWGTVSRALVRGLPLVLVPLTGDQPYTAERCAQLGIGIALTAETVTTAQLRAAVEAVLDEPGYRQAAAQFAAECRELAPLPTASSMIATLPHSTATTKP